MSKPQENALSRALKRAQRSAAALTSDLRDLDRELKTNQEIHRMNVPRAVAVDPLRKTA